MCRKAKLIMVTDINNNKFYDMVENADGSITATWGRVDVTSTVTHYPVGKKKWETLLKSKLKKGYVDMTELRSVEAVSIGFTPISQDSISKIVAELQAYANKSVQQNYTISTDAVTPQMIKTAQTIMNDLVPLVRTGSAAKPINDKLLALYRTIPRKMKKVQYHLIAEDTIDSVATLKVAEKLLATEQATLDVMAGQVKINTVQGKTTAAKPQTILDAMGLQLTDAPTTEIAQIRRNLGPNARQFKRGFTVTNLRTQKTFDTFVGKSQNKTIRQYWHGSRNENWWSIMESGLVLRPTNAVITGKMFGYGVYFADVAQKSIGYTSLRGSYWTAGNANKGFLSLYDVHLGHYLKIRRHESWCYDLNKQNLKKRGVFDSLYAEGGADLRNNEFIIYDDAQCTIKFLVEIG